MINRTLHRHLTIEQHQPL